MSLLKSVIRVIERCQHTCILKDEGYIYVTSLAGIYRIKMEEI